MLKLLLLVLFVISSTVLAQSPPLSAQDSKNVYPDLNTTNALGTWIYGFEYKGFSHFIGISADDLA
jgi:hypothetical protein